MRKGTVALLAVLYAASFVAAFNENIINVALVDIMAEYSVSSVLAQWLVTGYMAVTAIVVTVVAFLLKRFSLKTVFLAGAVMLIVGLVGAYLAPTFWILLVFRLIQGVGTGIFIPTMMNSCLVLAPIEKLGTYMSIGSCCITFGPALGPVGSGVMVTWFGWRAIFLPPLVVMVILLIIGLFTVHKITETETIRMDALSIIESTLGLFLFVYGMAELTLNTPMALGAIALSVIIIVLFVRRQLKLEVPLLDVRPLKNPLFALCCLLIIVCMMMTFSSSVLLPLYYEGALGYSAFAAGFFVLLPLLINAITALLGGRILDKHGPWPVLPIGYLMVVIGQVAITLTSSHMALVLVVVGSAFVFSGVGLCMSPTQTAGLEQLTREQHPYGVSLASTFIQMAAAVGPSLFMGVLASSSARALASGTTAQAAQAAGISSATLVASCIAFAGFVVSIVYARAIAKRNATKSPVVKREEA